jgi:hypothetical protein
MDYTIQQVIQNLVHLGLPGITIALLVGWIYMLQTKLDQLQQARIVDAQNFTDRALKLQESVHTSIDKLETLTLTLIRGSKDE